MTTTLTSEFDNLIPHQEHEELVCCTLFYNIIFNTWPWSLLFKSKVWSKLQEFFGGICQVTSFHDSTLTRVQVMWLDDCCIGQTMCQQVFQMKWQNTLTTSLRLSLGYNNKHLVKATTGNIHFVLILVVPVDKIGSVSPLPRGVKILIWLARVFVLEASERKTKLVCDTIFLFWSQLFAGCSDEVMYLFVAM